MHITPIKHDYSATFACLNNLSYTQQCLESLKASGFDMRRLVVVDNGSTDGTWEYLQTQPDIITIRNKENLSCGVAWNQGALALQTEWTIIMNNDILFMNNWFNELIDQAIEHKLLVASPAMIEGPLNYDFHATAAQYRKRMHGHVRPGYAHAVCLLVHRSVWHRVGYFRASPKLLGYEDTIFFFECMQAGIAHAALANSWIHHFGSVTVKSLRQTLGTNSKGGLGDRHNSRLLDQSWLMRKWRKWLRTRLRASQRAAELQQYECTVHAIIQDETNHWF